MALDRINTARFHSDKNQARKTAKAQLGFIYNNFDAFRKKANESQITAFHSFCEMDRNNEVFTDGQLSFIDDLYEKTMAGLGLPSYIGMKYKNHVRIIKG